MQLSLRCDDPQRESELASIAEHSAFNASRRQLFALILTAERLELRKTDEPKLSAVFTVICGGGTIAHRRKFGGGKGQAIAPKPAGLKKGATPTILDGTAGLGRDAFVLASLGCKVQMVERNPVVAALLDDGLSRAKRVSEIGGWVTERMSLLHASSHDALTQLTQLHRLLLRKVEG